MPVASADDKAIIRRRKQRDLGALCVGIACGIVVFGVAHRRTPSLAPGPSHQAPPAPGSAALTTMAAPPPPPEKTTTNPPPAAPAFPDTFREVAVSPDGRVAAAARTDDQDAAVTYVRLRWTDAAKGAFVVDDAIAEMRMRSSFGSWFSAALVAAAPYAALFWECPPVTRRLAATQPFECVVFRSAGFRRASPRDFAEYFAACDPTARAVTFENLGRDATLVAPCPRGTDADHARAYGHLAAFCRHAPTDQQDALWRDVGDALVKVLAQKGDDQPTWLSTAGQGVPWLHVRLDSRPKYYNYDPYRAWPPHRAGGP
mmetsp:Transcript_20064/g.80038  ORF Transcript_20064/g.80038 Transcript_20064/m.80038 type:complete len:315 (-) Transcript_20064:162-1106(-)